MWHVEVCAKREQFKFIHEQQAAIGKYDNQVAIYDCHTSLCMWYPLTIVLIGNVDIADTCVCEARSVWHTGACNNRYLI